MQDLVSIIIPCYNQGHFLEDALQSIDQSAIEFPVQVIIINDGSTDEMTIQKISELALDSRYIVISQENMGLSAARNTGIARAGGSYILPLDADNKILPAYINKAVPLLASGQYDIVYGSPIFFGENKKIRKYRSIPFDGYTLLERNYIDACAVFKKDVWVKNGGYDTGMPIKTHEDWEFWINAYSNGFRFCFLDEPLFFYRISSHSMVDAFSKEKFAVIHKYIFKKHPAIFLYHFMKLSYIKRKYDTDIKRWLLSPFIFLLYRLKIIKNPEQKAIERLEQYDPLSKPPQP